MVGYMKTKSEELNGHKRLIQLISEESTLIEKETDQHKRNRHMEIIGFLVELQSITSQRL